MKKQYCYPIFLLFFSCCVTIKSNKKPHILNKNEKQLGISHNPIHIYRKSIEKSKNLTKPSIKDRLKKLSNLKVSTFIAGMTTAMMAGVVVHRWGHWIIWNHFHPDSTGIKKRNPYIDLQNIDLREKNNHFKIALGCVSGPIIGFLGSYGLFKVLAEYNTKKSTYSPLLSGLEFGSKVSSLSILTLIYIVPFTDGYQAVQFLQKKYPSYDLKWYSYPTKFLAIPVILKFLKPDFIRHCSHLFS